MSLDYILTLRIAESVTISLGFLYMIVFKVCTKDYFSLSLCPCTIKLAL